MSDAPAARWDAALGRLSSELLLPALHARATRAHELQRALERETRQAQRLAAQLAGEAAAWAACGAAVAAGLRALGDAEHGLAYARRGLAGALAAAAAAAAADAAGEPVAGRGAVAEPAGAPGAS